MIGRALGSYRVVEKLGAGGMGEVYRARDERLGRDVALKLLPEGQLGDEAARSRFRKEAQALLLLSHPHVATLFDYGSADGVDYLAMELVPGPTLAETLRSGPLPAREVVKLGAQLARGLRAAHEQGIVHRDLKPSNLCLTSDGLLKVLDFGLARLAPEAVRAGGEDTPTETAAGTVVGSPPYMSPEQLLGKEVDARSDVYSAGACLYELATGRRPFGERSGAALVDAILHEAPEALDFAGGDVPAGLQSVITKAMDKNPSLRYQTAAELLVDLERLQAAGSHALPASPQGAGMRRRPAAALLWAVPVVGVSVAALLIWSLRSPELPRVVDVRPLGLPLGGELGVAHGILSWATDGQRIYYVGPAPGGKAGLFQVSASGGDASELPLPFEYYLRIEGYMAREGALLMRGASAGDVERGEQPGEPPVDGVPMWVVPLPAGPARRLGLAGDGLAASPDGERFARVRGGRLAIVRIDGTVLRTLDTATNVRRAAWDTAGRRIRYFVGDPDVGRGQVWEWPVDGNGAPRLVEADASDVGRFTRYGRHFVFARANQRFPRRDLYVAREPRFPWSSQTQAVPLSSGPLDMWDAGPDPGSHRLLALGRAPRGELLRYEPQSSRFEPFLEGLSAHYVDPSPDGSWLAWTSFPETELWKSRADGSGRARLTPPGWWAVLARWSPDARSVSFVARRPDELTQGLFRVSPEGGEPQLLVPDPGGERIWDACWTPDGKAIVYSLYGKAGLRQVDVRSRSSTPFPGGESLAYPKCSRDGSILATSFSPGARGGDWLWSAVAQSWRRLGPSRIAYPSFAHDGRSIIGYNAVQRRIERRWLDTGRFEPVADLRGVPLAVLLDVPWMGLLPDDSPLVLRDRSTPDIYALDWERP